MSLKKGGKRRNRRNKKGHGEKRYTEKENKDTKYVYRKVDGNGAEERRMKGGEEGEVTSNIGFWRKN
jgi:hypothetical protein